jgi:hypothetical protein
VNQLIRDLRAAGWCHAREWVDTGRDTDGAPHDDGFDVHRWRRGGAAITVWGEDQPWPTYVTFDPHDDEGNESGDIMIGADWIAENGASGLRRLAHALGIIAPVVPAGLTLLTVNLTARAMEALTTGAAAVDCSMTDFVSRALVVYGTIAAELADGSTVSVSEVRS